MLVLCTLQVSLSLRLQTLLDAVGFPELCSLSIMLFSWAAYGVVLQHISHQLVGRHSCFSKVWEVKFSCKLQGGKIDKTCSLLTAWDLPWLTVSEGK